MRDFLSSYSNAQKNNLQPYAQHYDSHTHTQDIIAHVCSLLKDEEDRKSRNVTRKERSFQRDKEKQQRVLELEKRP